MKNAMKYLVLSCALVALAACGGDKKPASGDGGNAGGTPAAGNGGSEGGGGTKKAYNAADHKGSITGTIKLAGAKPDPRKLAIAGDEFCVGAVGGAGMDDPDYHVNDDGTVPNALVTVTGATVDGYTYDVPADRKLEVTQRNCMYEPHVFTVMVNQKFIVSNSDATQHNVHSKPKRHDEFNKAQNEGEKDELVFTKKESQPVPFVCDIHSWMNAWCIVTDHPFATVTDASGKFEIKGLPAGTYTVKVWTKELGKATMDVTVGDTAVAQDFEIK